MLSYTQVVSPLARRAHPWRLLRARCAEVSHPRRPAGSVCRARRGARLEGRRDPRSPAPSLPLPIRRPDFGIRAGRADCRPEKRHPQQYNLSKPLLHW